MEAVHTGKLEQIVFERLTLGESREKLHGELCRKLDDAAASALLDRVIREMAARRERGDYEAAAGRLRKKRFGSPYLAWKLLGGFLLFIGVANSIYAMANSGSLYIAFGPLAVGLVIFAVVEDKVRRKVQTAAAAVEQLLVGAAPA